MHISPARKTGVIITIIAVAFWGHYFGSGERISFIIATTTTCLLLVHCMACKILNKRL